MSVHDLVSIDLTRREAAASLATGALALAFGRLTAAPVQAPEPVPFLLGFSLYGMRSLKTADALRTVKEIGYASVELAVLPGWPCDVDKLSAKDQAQLKREVDDSGLQLSALMDHLPLDAAGKTSDAQLARLKKTCELARELNPTAPPVVETILGGAPANWEKSRDEFVRSLVRWEQVAAAAKVVLAIKPHVAGALHTPAGAAWLLERVRSPWLKVTYDFSHYQLRGLKLDESLATLIKDTAFIHVKDARGTAEKFEFLLPGAGTIDYVDYFRRLVAAKYRGGVVVEVSGQIHTRPGYDPVAAAKAAYAPLAAARDRVK